MRYAIIVAFAHLRGFHDDWANNVISRVKQPPPPGSHVIQLIGTIYELNSHIKETNVLTKFHKNRAKNVTSRVENAPPTGGHVFSPIWTIFELVRVINKTNVHVIQRTGTIFELNSHIKETNVLTKFHANWAKNVTSKVFTCFHYLHIEQNAPPTSGHVFSPIWTIFELVRVINKTNVHVIQRTGTIFKLNSHIKETNVLTKFHENWAKNVSSRVFTCFHYIHKEKNAPPTGGHLFSPIWTIFERIRDINKTNETNVLNKFHENWTKNVTSRVFTCFHYKHKEKNAPPTGGHVFSPIWTIFELVRDINETNLLTNFHDDWAKIVTSRVFTRKTAPPTGGHANISTNFELGRDFIRAKFLTNKCLRTDGRTDIRRTKTGQKS
ncbi:hypothetical protein DPMN_099402 [Dreissena polymorpha]|uniref:Uncharacterized protein n=1 Tax=Dreissena polymorpha TaxID=45954 RepID=A0A9D4LDV0_DREPO|nr:hypothetical protein DPMN_099402 [Dreissena polymorpha]